MGWIPGFSACSGQHAWHSYRAGCIVISESSGARNSHGTSSAAINFLMEAIVVSKISRQRDKKGGIWEKTRKPIIKKEMSPFLIFIFRCFRIFSVYYPKLQTYKKEKEKGKKG